MSVSDVNKYLPSDFVNIRRINIVLINVISDVVLSSRRLMIKNTGHDDL
jgi:hypothetical protein